MCCELVAYQDLKEESDRKGTVVCGHPSSHMHTHHTHTPHTHHTHTCFLSQYVYASHLLRKDKLVNFFKELGVFRDDVRLPVEVCERGSSHC